MNMRGQAMAEFAVACSVLALLLVGLPVIARYQQTQFQLIGTARLAATLRGWSPRAIADEEALRLSQFPANDDPRRPEVQRLQLQSSSDAAPGTAAAGVEALLAPLFAAGALGGADFDLERGGYQRVSLRAGVRATEQASLPDPFDALDLELTEHHALLADAWNSSGPAQVAVRTGGLVPTAAFGSLRALLAPVRAAASVVEPALRQLCLGQIDPERVPDDRLGTVVDDGPRSTWEAPC